MGGLKKAIIRAGLETLYFSGAHVALRPFFQGVGAILTLHHVRPARPAGFQPNRLLEVSPGFFAAVVRRLRRSGLDIVSLDEMYRRLVQRDFKRRFVCITFDDGYRDLLQWAYPVLKKHEAPFALYVPTSFPDRIGEIWWVALERVVASTERIGLYIDGVERRFDCASLDDKRNIYEQLYWWLRSLSTEDELRVVIRDLAARYGVDMAALCDELCMSWEDIAELARDPLVTIGAHSVNHYRLRKTPDRVVRAEMEMSRAVIESAIGFRPEHFAYPVGDPSSAGSREFAIAAELGFKTAVTTQPGVLFREHRNHLTALPRISLNGEYQQLRYLGVLMSGTATAMWNGFRRGPRAA
ncbi:polysaccharide deacetylase family protein [Pseudorhodoplanes sp.]|uniref:polysaccharide deacetylase family protein n=1 Tax=Pseudorhodoplanes sp. TaxID=1934341 RepID=UPI00391B725B